MRRPASPSVIRAWLVAHDAVPVGSAMAVFALGLSVGAQWLLPVPGSVRVVPLWQLAPPLLAALSSLATVNRLPADVPGAVLRGTRAAWAAAVTGLACGAVALVGAGSGLDPLVPATALLVGLTFAASCLVGRTSAWVGGAGLLVIVLHTDRYAGGANPWGPGPGLLWTLGVPVALAGTAAYAWFGASPNLLGSETLT